MRKKTEGKKSASSPAKSKAAATTLPCRETGRDSEPSPAIAKAMAGIDQQKLRENAFKVFGGMHRHWDFMREVVGEAWDDDLTDTVFQALFVHKRENHPKPNDSQEAGRHNNPIRSRLAVLIRKALKSKDAAFFLRLGNSIEALNKVWPNGINEAMEPADKWRWTAARFIMRHWNKYGFAPTQQALREHLESMEDYHGQPTPQTGPLPKKTWAKERSRIGIFEHVDRSGGPPKKPKR